MVGVATAVAARLAYRSRSSESSTSSDGQQEGSSTDVLDEELALSGGALALQIVGIWLPSLTAFTTMPLSIVALSYLDRVVSRRKNGHTPWAEIYEFVFVGGTLFTGQYVLCAIGGLTASGGQKLIERTRRRTRDELVQVFGDLPTRAWILRDGVEVEVDISLVSVDTHVIVRAGNPIPVDGFVVKGVGLVDECSLTGESTPAVKSVSDEVYAATMVVEGPLVIRATRSGSGTTVGELQRILSNTDELTSRVRLRAERIVEGGAAPTLAFSALTLPLLGVNSAIAVCGVGFGYQMRAAGPLGALTYIIRAARGRVLVKDARALELLGEVDTVLFDKTGTMTTGTPSVIAVHPINGVPTRAVLQAAAAAEVGQTHPIARAILAAAQAEEIDVTCAERVEVATGRGLRARVKGCEVRVGSAQLMRSDGVTIPEILSRETQNTTSVYVAVDHQVIGQIELATPIRDEAREVIQALQNLGREVAMVSGDRRAPAEQLAHELGIERVHAEVLPEEKAAIVRELQAKGRRVCFVGDGINDAIALKAADVSISLAGASSVATDTAALIMLDGNLNRLPELFELAREYERNLDLGTWLAVAPGVLCIGGVYLFHASIITTMSFYFVSLAISVGNAVVPALDSRREVHSVSGGPPNET